MTMSLPHTAVIQNVCTTPVLLLPFQHQHLFFIWIHTRRFGKPPERTLLEEKRSFQKGKVVSSYLRTPCSKNDQMLNLRFSLERCNLICIVSSDSQCYSKSVSHMLVKFRICLKLKQGVATTTTNVILVFNHMVNRKRKQEMGALLFGN